MMSEVQAAKAIIGFIGDNIGKVGKNAELPNVTPWLKNVTEATPDFASGGFKPVTKLDVDFSPGAIVKADMPGLPTRFADDVIDVDFVEGPNTTRVDLSGDGSPAIDVKATTVTDDFDPTPTRTPQTYSYRQADGAGDIPGTDLANTQTKQLVDSSAPDTPPSTWSENIRNAAEDAKKNIVEFTQKSKQQLEETYGKMSEWTQETWKKVSAATGKSIEELKAMHASNPNAFYTLVGGTAVVSTGVGAGAVALTTNREQQIMADSRYAF